MAGLINELLDILHEQAQRCEELLGLSQEKRGVIIANDVESLQKITHLENLIVSQNQKLERKRTAVLKDIATVLNKKENELTLSVLAELMQGQEEQSAIVEVGERLRRTLHELSDVNAHNASLIQNALDYIDYSLNVIRSSASNSAFFTAKGEQITDGTPFFDAKH